MSDIEHGLAILQRVASWRFATGLQVQRALFNRGATNERQARHRATRALRRLFESGYLNRAPVFAPSAVSDVLSRQIVHVLSASVARAIEVEPRWARQRAPKPSSVLGHDFWVVEAAVLAMEGCPKGLAITHWWDDRVLTAQRRRGVLSLATVPDALLVVRHERTGKDYPCLVELDLGSESVRSRSRERRDFSRKITGYLDYDAATFRQEFGIDGNPIVLIICDSQRRLEHLRETAQKLGGAGRFWFVTLAQLRANGIANQVRGDGSAGPESPFWASSWQTADDDKLRSLAVRCGVERSQM